MMVIVNDKNEIIIKPDKREKIIQGIKTLVSTPIGSVPLDRGFGIDFSFIDKPADIAKQLFTSQFYDKLNKYFPEIKIESIEFIEKEQSIYGRFYPVIRLEPESLE